VFFFLLPSGNRVRHDDAANLLYSNHGLRKTVFAGLCLYGFEEFRFGDWEKMRNCSFTRLRIVPLPHSRLCIDQAHFRSSHHGRQDRESGARRLPSTPARTGTGLGVDGCASCVRPMSPRSDVERTPTKEATMKLLITDNQRTQLLDNGAATVRGEKLDPLPVVKLFTPDAHATWLLTELNPDDNDTAYGLCDLGVGLPELGYVRLSDLQGIVGPMNLPVERDLYFIPKRRLSEYAELARTDGSIND
jgi:hypothetical protein